MHDSKFIVSHIAARRDYDVATILCQSNLLDKLFIDAYYSRKHLKIFRLLDIILPKTIVDTYKRYQPSVPHELVDYDWPLGLKYKLHLRFGKGNNSCDTILNAYRELAKNTLAYAKKKKTPQAYYGFDTSSKDFFEWAAPRGWFLVLEQCVAPRATQIRMYNYFQDIYGIDQKANIEQCQILQHEEEREWQLASIIICPSKYVKDELIKAGAPVEKLRMIPFGYDVKKHSGYTKEILENRFSNSNRETKILFAGNAGYRKGINEIISIANDLRHENVEFVIAGNIGDNCESLIQSSNLTNVTLLGKLPVADLHNEYRKSDIFLFPSYLEGSAMVIFEAMSWGLPIVTTYESGSVVEDGQEGFLCRAGDSSKIKLSVLRLIHEKDLRLALSRNARNTAEKFSLEYYRKNLLQVIDSQYAPETVCQ